MQDYYARLGIAADADIEVIKAAYRAKAIKCHPDRGGSHREMLLLNAAWEILANPERRVRYDREREAAARPASVDHTRRPQTHPPDGQAATPKHHRRSKTRSAHSTAKAKNEPQPVLPSVFAKICIFCAVVFGALYLAYPYLSGALYGLPRSIVARAATFVVIWISVTAVLRANRRRHRTSGTATKRPNATNSARRAS